MRLKSVFLAGPDVYAPGADRLLERKRRLVEAAGLELLTPVLPAAGGRDEAEITARATYAEVLTELRRADALIANLTPWRGAGCHPGAAFLAGFAAALGKPVFAYMNVEEEGDAELLGRIERLYGADLGGDGLWRDDDGVLIEDLGLPETLMLWAEARRFFVVVTQDLQGDGVGLELCLDALKLYAS
jgi:nucleoside 2-deoxyribosyltransferase